jgi:formylmethanofuran dehydrogenase subunit C
MKTKLNLLAIILLTTTFSLTVWGQTGGTYDLSHNVIASGGGSNSTGGSITIDGTIGQGIAGTVSTNGTLIIRGGFWAFQSFAPTAALVSISGKVKTQKGRGIRNVRVTLTGTNGVIRSIQTSTFGYFHFDEIEVGQTYILEVSGKHYIFINPTRVLSIDEEIKGIEFIAQPQ